MSRRFPEKKKMKVIYDDIFDGLDAGREYYPYEIMRHIKRKLESASRDAKKIRLKPHFSYEGYTGVGIYGQD